MQRGHVGCSRGSGGSPETGSSGRAAAGAEGAGEAEGHPGQRGAVLFGAGGQEWAGRDGVEGASKGPHGSKAGDRQLVGVAGGWRVPRGSGWGRWERQLLAAWPTQLPAPQPPAMCLLGSSRAHRGASCRASGGRLGLGERGRLRGESQASQRPWRGEDTGGGGQPAWRGDFSESPGFSGLRASPSHWPWQPPWWLQGKEPGWRKCP